MIMLGFVALGFHHAQRTALMGVLLSLLYLDDYGFVARG